jgi:hypothetical protein
VASPIQSGVRNTASFVGAKSVDRYKAG